MLLVVIAMKDKEQRVVCIPYGFQSVHDSKASYSDMVVWKIDIIEMALSVVP